jgi:hypothetical protein
MTDANSEARVAAKAESKERDKFGVVANRGLAEPGTAVTA